jgi:hypothetical protein
MEKSDSWPYSDYTTESARDEEMWDDLVILPVAPQKPSSPPSRTVWEILTERLAKTSFEARFVDAEREANEASIERTYQWDPTKRHTWTSRCGCHQVVGYFNFYMHTQGIVGLFTEEGFPVQVKLNGLSGEDVRFVLNKLGHSLRGKVEAQLSADQSVKQVEGSKDIKKKNIRTIQKSSASATEQQGTDEGPKSTSSRRFQDLRGSCHNEEPGSTRESRRLLNEVRQQRERALRSVAFKEFLELRERRRKKTSGCAAETEVVSEPEKRAGLYEKYTRSQSRKGDTTTCSTSAAAKEVLWERQVAGSEADRLALRQSADAQACGSDSPAAPHAPLPDQRLWLSPPVASLAKSVSPRSEGGGSEFSENRRMQLQEKHFQE